MGSMTGSPGVRLRARETNTMQHMYHTTSRIKVLDISTLENRSKTTHTRHRRDPTLSQAKYTDIPTINGTNTNQRSPSIPSWARGSFFPCPHTQLNAACAFLSFKHPLSLSVAITPADAVSSGQLLHGSSSTTSASTHRYMLMPLSNELFHATLCNLLAS